MKIAVCVPATDDTVASTARLMPTPRDIWHANEVPDTHAAVWQSKTPTRVDGDVSWDPKLSPDTVTLHTDVTTPLASTAKLTAGAMGADAFANQV